MADREKVKKNKPNRGAKKESKKLFTQKTFLGVTLLGALVLVAVYVFVYTDYNDKTESINASNANTRARISELQVYADNLEAYETSIDDMKNEILDILSEYPAGAREEDVIMLAVDIQNNNTIDYSSISMNDAEELYSIPYEEVSVAGIEGYESNVLFADKRSTYAITTTYDDLKNVVADIFDSDNRIGLNNIILSRNEDDGTLGGSIELSFYYAVGTDKEYTAPKIAKYIAGTDNIFRSSAISESLEDDESDEESEGEENAENGEKKGN